MLAHILLYRGPTLLTRPVSCHHVYRFVELRPPDDIPTNVCSDNVAVLRRIRHRGRPATRRGPGRRGRRARWHDLKDRGGAVDGDQVIIILVGPGIPMVVEREFVDMLGTMR